MCRKHAKPKIGAEKNTKPKGKRDNNTNDEKSDVPKRVLSGERGAGNRILVAR